MLYGVSPLQGRRLRLGVHPGRLTNQIRGNPRDLRNAFGRVLLDVLRQIFESMGELFHELLVIEALLADHVDDPQGQGLSRPGRNWSQRSAFSASLSSEGPRRSIWRRLQLCTHLAGDQPFLVG